MAIPTKIDFGDFFKAVRLISVKKGFTCKPYNGSKGSAICFNFFRAGEEEPFGVFCVHEDKHRKVIYSDDLKKACKQLGVTKEEFEVFIKNGFK